MGLSVAPRAAVDDRRRLVLGRGDVRTRQVQLERRGVRLAEPSAEVRVLRGREAADRHPHRRADLEQPRQDVGEEAVDAGVGQADRVEHSDVRLGDADGRIPLARERRHRLRDEDVELPRHLGRGEGVQAAGSVQDHAAAPSRRVPVPGTWPWPPRTGPSTQSLAILPSISTAQP